MHPQEAVIGVNVVNPMRASVPKPDPHATMRIRVGVPLVARGPAPDIADAAFSAIQLPDGRFRGFTAAGTTWAIDGAHPYDMSGPAVAVLKAGPPGTPDSCGQWVVHVCEAQNYQRLRSAGFIYDTPQPNAQPLYRGYSDTEHSHFASNRDDCNTMGKREELLGYDLKE